MGFLVYVIFRLLDWRGFYFTTRVTGSNVLYMYSRYLIFHKWTVRVLLYRYNNRLLLRIKMLYCVNQEILGSQLESLARFVQDKKRSIFRGTIFSEPPSFYYDISPPEYHTSWGNFNLIIIRFCLIFSSRFLPFSSSFYPYFLFLPPPLFSLFPNIIYIFFLS